jgi:hypothetical protein
MWFNNVVFPLPRNPVKTVIGILSSSFLFDELLFALLSSVCCSRSLVAARADRRLPPPPPRALFKEANHVLLSGGHVLSSFFLDALETLLGASRERKKEAPPLAPNTTFSDAALIFFRF